MANAKTHLEFADTLKMAHSRGVNVLAFDCHVGEEFIEISDNVEVDML